MAVQTESEDEAHLDAAEQALKTLTDASYIKPFVEKLCNSGQLKDFMGLISHLMQGTISMSNLAWKSILHRSRWQSCSTTCNMYYDEDYVEFWSVVYLMFGNSCLSVFRGPCHYSQVVLDESKKSSYNPHSGSCNFALPSVPTLRKIDTGYARKVVPGFIQHSIDQAKKESKNGNKQFTLSFDGKKIGRGCKGRFINQLFLSDHLNKETFKKTCIY